jgi:hypothetical protein
VLHRVAMSTHVSTHQDIDLDNEELLSLRAEAAVIERLIAAQDSAISAVQEKRHNLQLILDKSATTGREQQTQLQANFINSADAEEAVERATFLSSIEAAEAVADEQQISAEAKQGEEKELAPAPVIVISTAAKPVITIETTHRNVYEGSVTSPLADDLPTHRSMRSNDSIQSEQANDLTHQHDESSIAEYSNMPNSDTLINVKAVNRHKNNNNPQNQVSLEPAENSVANQSQSLDAAPALTSPQFNRTKSNSLLSHRPPSSHEVILNKATLPAILSMSNNQPPKAQLIATTRLDLHDRYERSNTRSRTCIALFLPLAFYLFSYIYLIIHSAYSELNPTGDFIVILGLVLHSLAAIALLMSMVLTVKHQHPFQSLVLLFLQLSFTLFCIGTACLLQVQQTAQMIHPVNSTVVTILQAQLIACVILWIIFLVILCHLCKSKLHSYLYLLRRVDASAVQKDLRALKAKQGDLFMKLDAVKPNN